MKSICTLLVVFLSVYNGYSTNWLSSFEDAQKLALVQNKLIVVDFWATWCGPCKKMDSDAWHTNEVGDMMNNFIPLKVDIDTQTNLARRYGIKAIPNVYIMDANGEIVADSKGYMDKVELLNFLDDFVLNTSYVNKELVNYFQRQNFANSLRLAKRYIDYSLLVDDKVKNNFFSVSNVYLDKANKMLENQPKFEEKIELLKMTIDVYRGNHKKVVRKLAKTDEATIDPINKADYYFINYCVCRSNNEADQASEWLDKLKTTSNFETYNSKINMIFKEDS
ncbi:thioredoxin domain-containing protein [Joostella sp. CR20]|uniref:thioredoxin domain-containing protein n=1 Tax=Joostella sp. CR20 TaxID=2804312 RepID=UPI00313CC136